MRIRAAAAEARDQDILELEPLLRRVVGARVHDPDTVDDLVQETLARVIAVRGRLDDEAVTPYAIVTARNLVTSLTREQERGRRHQPRLVDLSEPERPEDAALRRVELPTSRCRPVLLALSAGDRRRQLALDAGGHLMQCPTCASLSRPLVERRRSIAVLLPLLALWWLWRRLQAWARRRPVMASLTAASAVAVTGLVLVPPLVGRDQAPPPASTTTTLPPGAAPGSAAPGGGGGGGGSGCGWSCPGGRCCPYPAARSWPGTPASGSGASTCRPGASTPTRGSGSGPVRATSCGCS
jgi:RNA polymerase sigma factor (sigma-70 family)